MSHEDRAFPEYGGGGDEVGARRSRRAFRRSVFAVLFLTAMLFFSEKFLRYEQTERLYLSALTLDAARARPFLHSAVKQDAVAHETPTSKYLEALAEREEEGKNLPAYERAYAVDPNNSFLAIRYGCRLLLEGQAEEARARFQEAAAHSPKNALPRYLDAAALPWTREGQNDLRASLALITRASGSGERIAFPRPLWFSGLPQNGAWYQGLRRSIVDECCAPLYRYAKFVSGDAHTQIAQRQVQYLDSWLETLQQMGERLTLQSDPGTLQAAAGIRMQIDAIRLRNEVMKLETGSANPALSAREEKLQRALEVLNTFESSRDARIAESKAAFVFPLKLCAWSLALLLAVYLAITLLSKLIAPNPCYWTIAHSWAGKAVPAMGCGLLAGMLFVTLALQHYAAGGTAWMDWLAYTWWTICGALLVFGVVYPATILPRSRNLTRVDPSSPSVLKRARSCRRAAYLTLIRRYYGLCVGLFLSSMAVWVLVCRIVTALYPHEFELLTPGLYEEELDTVQRALAMME